MSNQSSINEYKLQVDKIQLENKLQLKQLLSKVLDTYPEVKSFNFSFDSARLSKFHILGINGEEFFFSFSIHEKFNRIPLEKSFTTNSQKDSFKSFIVESGLTKERLFDFCNDLFSIYSAASWTGTYSIIEIILELRPDSRYLDF